MEHRTILFVLIIITVKAQFTPDTACNFHIADKFFSVIPLMKTNPYEMNVSTIKNSTMQWNFCQPFKPSVCLTDETVPYAYSFLVQLVTTDVNTTIPDPEDENKTITVTKCRFLLK